MYGDRAPEAARGRRSPARLAIAIAAAAAAIGITAWLWWPERAPLGLGPEPTIDVAVRRGDTAVSLDRAAVGDRLVVRAPGATAVWLYRDDALAARCPDATAPEADGCTIDRGQRVLTTTVTTAGRHTLLVVASQRPAIATLDAAMAELRDDSVWFRRRELVVE